MNMTKDKQLEEKELIEFIFLGTNLHYEEAEQIGQWLYNIAGYRKQEWISVDEALPAESAWYLVNIINHFGLDVVTFTHYTKGYGWGVPDVTHWMPLPEAPKMRKEGEGK